MLYAAPAFCVIEYWKVLLYKLPIQVCNQFLQTSWDKINTDFYVYAQKMHGLQKSVHEW